MNEPQPVPVHIASSSVPLGTRKKYYTTTYQTVVLTAADPVQEILPQSSNRVCAYVQALDNDIVLGKDTGQAGAAGNTVTNVPSPSGTYIPKSNTTPYPLNDHDKVYAGVTTTSTNSRVAISATYCVEV